MQKMQRVMKLIGGVLKNALMVIGMITVLYAVYQNAYTWWRVNEFDDGPSDF